LVFVAAIGRPKDVSLVVDVSLDRTVVSYSDLDAQPPGPTALDDRVLVLGLGGLVVGGRTERAILSFEMDAGGRWGATIEVVLADIPAGESRLGLDILREWLMVYDPAADSVLFEPYEA
jgi:hypothetical protein